MSSKNAALIMFAVIAAFGLVMATAAVWLPIIQQAHAKGKPGEVCTIIFHTEKTVCHPRGP
jgi:hypothetical protein